MNDDEIQFEEETDDPTTPEEAQTFVLALRAESTAYVEVATDEQATRLGEYLSTRVQPAIKRIKEIFAEPKAAARKALEAVAVAERELLDPLEKLKADAKATIAAWAENARREARLREQRLMEQAHRVAQELRASEVAALEAEGEPELAEEMRREEVPLVVPTIAPPPKVRGVSIRERWVADCTDLRALCAAIARGEVDAAAVTFNQQFANNQAQATKGKLSWPGVAVRSMTSVAARR